MADIFPIQVAVLSPKQVAHAGNFVVSGGNDRSLRVWQETDEQLFLEEEREKHLESLHEEHAQVERKRIGDAIGSGSRVSSFRNLVHQLCCDRR